MSGAMEEKKPGFLRRAYRGLMKFISALRLFLINMVFLFVVVMLLVVVSQGELPKIPAKGALILDIEGTLVDQKSHVDPLALMMAENNPEEKETLLQDLIDAVSYAKDDDRITSIVLSLDYFVHGGISKILELSESLEEFRATGKKVIAVGDSFSQDQYLLAAQADEIYMNPMGAVLLEGYGVYRNYFKKALDKLEIDFHVFRVGEFKSAVEPFVRDTMSEEAREANLQWLNALWGEYIASVAVQRELTPADVNRYVNEADRILEQYQGNAATMAVASGLIDGVKNREEMNQYLIGQVGAEDEEGYYQGVSYRTYLWLHKLDKTKSHIGEKVGVIVASGNIVDGPQPPGMIGGDSTAALIRDARLDDEVRAVVLRIDSGGGSAFASEIIRQELLLLQQVGKPLVVSMGSVAASGGYWISAPADQIWAMPTTITGSIGIFGLFPTIDKALDKVGINNDGVGTTALTGAMRVDRPLNPMAGRLIQSSVEHGYSRFLDIVAKGRDMSRADVAKIAEGRVWSGIDAKNLGLVDELGGLSQAIIAAAELAQLEKYETKLIEPPLTPHEQLVRELMGGDAHSWLSAMFKMNTNNRVIGQLARWLAPFKKQLDYFNTMNDPQGLYLHCSVCVAP
jgi:protease-4